MIQEIYGYRIDVLVNMCKTHYQIKQAWAGGWTDIDGSPFDK